MNIIYSPYYVRRTFFISSSKSRLMLRQRGWLLLLKVERRYIVAKNLILTCALLEGSGLERCEQGNFIGLLKGSAARTRLSDEAALPRPLRL